jgi:hypothetical protein
MSLLERMDAIVTRLWRKVYITGVADWSVRDKAGTSGQIGGGEAAPGGSKRIMHLGRSGQEGT